MWDHIFLTFIPLLYIGLFTSSKLLSLLQELYKKISLKNIIFYIHCLTTEKYER